MELWWRLQFLKKEYLTAKMNDLSRIFSVSTRDLVGRTNEVNKHFANDLPTRADTQTSQRK